MAPDDTTVQVDDAKTRDEKRGGVALTYASERHQIETQYQQDKDDLQKKYQEDLKDVQQRWATANVGAGLNPDGSDPQGRIQGGQD